MLKQLLSLLLCVTVLFSTTPVLADGALTSLPPNLNIPALAPGEAPVGAVISPMKKGQVAPYTGVLLSPKAVATIITQLNTIDDQVKLEVDKTKGEDKAQCDFSLAEAQAKCTADKSVLQAQLDEKVKLNKILQEQLKTAEASRPNLPLWIAGGFVVGVVVTVLIAYAVVQAVK